MKICACVAEYNPFHLGHLRHLNYIKNQLKADKLIVIMSGSFTQRGEMAILDKFTRARHAVLSGADMVIELPTVFATANAEIFAKGACGILNSLGVVDTLCFGIESGTKEEYIDLAKQLNDESKEFKRALKEALDNGNSLAKAKFEAIKNLGGSYDEKLVSSPNNILALEYTKALLSLNSNIQIEPMIRFGNHNDKTLKKGETSASSIRHALMQGNKKSIKKSVPPFVYKDITGYPFGAEKLFMTSLLTTDAQDLAKVLDCTEGLENRIKALSKDNKNIETLIEKCATKRYTASRIRRIITANLLKITDQFVKECLTEKLYAKVLAISSESKDLISYISKNSSIPLLTRKSDGATLKKTALYSFEKDILANELYGLATGKDNNENLMLLI